MTNKEKALRLVWEHWELVVNNLNFRYTWEKSLSQFVNNYSFYGIKEGNISDAAQHAKLTASKISEYNPEEGKAILEELEKI